jgi:hypothetical protein
MGWMWWGGGSMMGSRRMHGARRARPVAKPLLIPLGGEAIGSTRPVSRGAQTTHHERGVGERDQPDVPAQLGEEWCQGLSEEELRRPSYSQHAPPLAAPAVRARIRAAMRVFAPCRAASSRRASTGADSESRLSQSSGSLPGSFKYRSGLRRSCADLIETCQPADRSTADYLELSFVSPNGVVIDADLLGISS